MTLPIAAAAPGRDSPLQATILRSVVRAGDLLAALGPQRAASPVARELRALAPDQPIDIAWQGGDALARIDGRMLALPAAAVRRLAEALAIGPGAAPAAAQSPPEETDVGTAGGQPPGGARVADAAPAALLPAASARAAWPAIAPTTPAAVLAQAHPVAAARAVELPRPLFAAAPDGAGVARGALQLRDAVHVAAAPAPFERHAPAVPTDAPIALRGDAWAGQPIRIDVEADADGQRGARRPAATRPAWTATLQLELPHLGTIEATVRVAGRAVAIALDAPAAAALRAALPELAAGLAAWGLEPVGLAAAGPAPEPAR